MHFKSSNVDVSKLIKDLEIISKIFSTSKEKYMIYEGHPLNRTKNCALNNRKRMIHHKKCPKPDFRKIIVRMVMIQRTWSLNRGNSKNLSAHRYILDLKGRKTLWKLISVCEN